MKNSIAERVAEVERRIRETAVCAQRSPNDITLIAVSKTWPTEMIMQAYKAGMRHFGENRPEELQQKRAEINHRLGEDNDIIWHYIAPLQSRQTHAIADNADVFHALDRLKIANRLSQRRQAQGLPSLPVLLQVNVSGEASKSGLNATQWEDNKQQQGEIQRLVETIASLPALHPIGVMTMGIWGAEHTILKPIFQRTKALGQWLQSQYPSLDFSHYSMGMTDDFELGITEGATHVRVGRAIFGERTYTR